MTRNAQLRAASALALVLTISISCADTAALKQAAADQAQASARVNLLDLPTECHTSTPHAALVIGADPLNVLKLERIQLNRSNESKARCVDVHDAQAKALR